MNVPFFSIIIPCFNSVGSIRQTMMSIIEQRCSDYEILIVDGASSDDTLAIVKSFQHPAITIISEPDLGTYDAMNKGIQKATGQWLYFLGSDDYLFDDQVLSDMQLVIAGVDSKVVYGDVKVKGDSLWAKDGTVYGGEFDFQMLYKNNICHQSIFYNKEFVLRHKISYNLRYPVSADWDFNFRCWQKTRFTFAERIVAVFQAGGISSQNVTEPFHRERKKYLPWRVRMTERLKRWRMAILK